MLQIIFRELRFHFSLKLYRRVQIAIVFLSSLIFFGSAFEFATEVETFDAGRKIFTIFVPSLFVVMICFASPLFVVESFKFERKSAHFDLLRLTPIGTKKIVIGKMIGSFFAQLLLLLPTSPIFVLSIHTGGFSTTNLWQTITFFAISLIIFSMIGVLFSLIGSVEKSLERSYGVIAFVILVPIFFFGSIRKLSPLIFIIELIR